VTAPSTGVADGRLSPLQQDLIELLAATRRAEHELYEGTSEADLAAAVGDEGWTLKDVRAHLAAWRAIEARRLVADDTAGDPLVGDPVDASNARLFADRAGWSAAQVADASDASFVALDAAIRQSSTEALCECDDSVAGIGTNGVNHAVGHLSDVARLVAGERRYDAFADEVEAIASRAHLPPRDSGVLLYNLACHSALTGRPDEARRLLRTAFARRPELRDLAVDDPDLVSLRTELRALSEG
jgi:hypothetical protein